MKCTITLLTLLACAVTARAQGTLQFEAYLTGANQIPPNGSSLTGQASVTLSGTHLTSAGIVVPIDYFISASADIFGPAGLIYSFGSLGTVLGENKPIVALASIPGSNFDFSLTPQQASDLTAGLWYVNLATETYPLGEIRGQFALVPEPGTVVLLGTGFLALALGVRRRGPEKTDKKS